MTSTTTKIHIGDLVTIVRVDFDWRSTAPPKFTNPLKTIIGSIVKVVQIYDCSGYYSYETTLKLPNYTPFFHESEIELTFVN